MQRKKSNQIEWLEFDLLNETSKVKHAVFLRHGGYSLSPFNSLNAGLYVGDQIENVKGNLTLIEKQLQTEMINWKQMVSGIANHQDGLALVDLLSPAEIPEVDGLMTANPGISLMMRHADCQVALFYDPQNHAIANVHCGWRGNVAYIYQKAIQKMQQLFHSKPADLLVCITPSLGPDEAEFIHYKTEFPKEFWDFQLKPNYFDLWAISEYQLQIAGILPSHIEIARLSTYANTDDFFSHRKEKITGRHATCITLL